MQWKCICKIASYTNQQGKDIYQHNKYITQNQATNTYIILITVIVNGHDVQLIDTCHDERKEHYGNYWQEAHLEEV